MSCPIQRIVENVVNIENKRILYINHNTFCKACCLNGKLQLYAFNPVDNYLCNQALVPKFWSQLCCDSYKNYVPGLPNGD